MTIRSRLSLMAGMSMLAAAGLISSLGVGPQVRLAGLRPSGPSPKRSGRVRRSRYSDWPARGAKETGRYAGWPEGPLNNREAGTHYPRITEVGDGTLTYAKIGGWPPTDFADKRAA